MFLFFHQSFKSYSQILFYLFICSENDNHNSSGNVNKDLGPKANDLVPEATDLHQT